MKLRLSVLLYSGCAVLCVQSAYAQQSLDTRYPKPVFRNGEAQEVPEFSNSEDWIYEELWVETTFDSDNDGKPDRMHVWVTRPSYTDSSDLKLPVVFMPSPYYGLKLWAMLGLGNGGKNWKIRHELGKPPKSRKHKKLGTREKPPLWMGMYDHMWVPRGYITVYSSSPGTGLSDGCPTIGGENESLAPKAVIDWLCGRAKAYTTRSGNTEITAKWSSGRVGMMGTSYDGTLCVAAATTGVEGLKAIIPIAPVTSFYEYYRANGLVRSPDGYPGEDVDVLYDMINTGDRSKRKANNARVRDGILVPGIDRATGDYNDFWAARDYLPKIDSMKAAMLMAHGFNDWNVMPSQSFRFYEAAKAKGLPVQLYYHQGAHGGEPPFSMMNRWFTHYLHGVENEVEKDAPVKIVREFKSMPTAYAAYPDVNAADVTLHLKAGSNHTGTLELTAVTGPQTDSLTDDYHHSPQELTEAKNATHRLLFLTPELKKDLRISGTGHIQIRLASSKPAANLSVYLVALPWEDEKGTPIFQNVITRAWADPQNHASLSAGEPLVPGTFYDLQFDFMPDDQVIPAGQQIGLLIFSSDETFTLCPKPGTELIIDLESTSIQLPVVGGEAAFQQVFR